MGGGGSGRRVVRESAAEEAELDETEKARLQGSHENGGKVGGVGV